MLPKSCTTRFHTGLLWTILVLVSYQVQEISGDDLNATVLIANVPVDPAVVWSVKKAFWTVFWRHAKNGDLFVLTGVRSLSARGMPS